MKILITESQFRRILNEYNDKYSSFKERWLKVSYESIGCYEIPRPLSVDVFLFPSDEDDYNGFLIDLKLDNNIVGQYHSVIDKEDSGGLMNDIEIAPEYQGKGFGKILTLIAMCVSENVLGFFTSDVRGLTDQQKNVYNSLQKNVYDETGNVDYNKAQEFINQQFPKN